MNTIPDLVPDTPLPSPPVISETQPENCVLRHPGATLLLVAGLGVAAVIITRALTPAPPRNRAMRLLEDIQQQLATFAEDGSHAVGRGMDSLGDLHLNRALGKISRRFKALLH